MKEDKIDNKMKKIRNILFVIGGMSVILNIVFGRSGKLILVGVTFQYMLFIVAGIIIIISLWLICNEKTKNTTSTKVLAIVLTTVFLGIGIYGETKVVKDLVEGRKVAYLSNCDVYYTGGVKGIINSYYNLTGFDENGKKHKFIISAKAAHDLEDVPSIKIEYYENVNGIYSYNTK